ncbi:YihY/virulence factor BrkB family protein [Amycolatopsis palatopharyngis]|uniref:YihY/virulence factor BrkB family protein n=1 Tax=Amycolatopsis palatopharyngis TaxID=187982 RepID=UPI000E25987C|nr:YihY/virulence factor BrkB family protein [Amycolatopsis palatopharyngis]
MDPADDHREFGLTERKQHRHQEASPGPGTWWAVAKGVVHEIREDQLMLAAAGIAFFGMLALVPALIALLTIFALVADAQYVRDQIEPIVSALPGGASDLVVRQLRSAAELGDSGLTFGLLASVVAVLWSTSTAMRALIGGINRAYDRPETRGFLRLRGLALVLTLGALVVVAIALGTVAALPVVLNVLGVPDSARWIVSAVRWLGLLVLISAALTVLYRYAPDREHRRWRWYSAGTAAAVLLWLAGSVAFSFYVEGFGRYQGTYGTLAGIVVLLLWLYLSSFSVLFGAEVDAVLRRGPRVRDGARRIGRRHNG